KQISNKRMKNKAKNDKTENGMEKYVKSESNRSQSQSKSKSQQKSQSQQKSKSKKSKQWKIQL
ncbi:hypothetical protein Tco_0235369, partial [Tanacetum coccineum]